MQIFARNIDTLSYFQCCGHLPGKLAGRSWLAFTDTDEITLVTSVFIR